MRGVSPVLPAWGAPAAPKSQKPLPTVCSLTSPGLRRLATCPVWYDFLSLGPQTSETSRVTWQEGRRRPHTGWRGSGWPLTRPLAPQRDQVVFAPRGREVRARDDHRVRAHCVQHVHHLQDTMGPSATPWPPVPGTRQLCPSAQPLRFFESAGWTERLRAWEPPPGPALRPVALLG